MVFNASGSNVAKPGKAAPPATSSTQVPTDGVKKGKKSKKLKAIIGQKRKTNDNSRTEPSTLCAHHQLARIRAEEDSTPADPTIAELVSAGTSFDLIKSSIYSLDNEPHRLFRGVEWEAPDLPGVNTTGLDGHDRDYYMDILPALQIASHILVHPDVLPFWHGLFESAQKGRRQGLDAHYFAKRLLTSTEAAETLKTLDKMGPQVSIWSTSRMHNKYMATTNVRCLQQGDAGYDPTRRVKPYGRNSHGEWAVHLPRNWLFVYISISTHTVDIARSWQDPKSTMTIAEIENFYFRLTIQLLHEMAHAVQKLSDMSSNCFFRDETVCETGFSFENFVFGGLVRNLSQGSYKHLTINSWPNSDLCEYYNGPIKIQGKFSGMKVRGWLPPSRKIAFVKRGYVSLFFHPGFWKIQRTGRAVYTRELRPYDFVTAATTRLPDRIETPWLPYFSLRRRLLMVPHCCRRIQRWDKLGAVEMPDELRRARIFKKVKKVPEHELKEQRSGFGHPRSRIVLESRTERLREKASWRQFEALYAHLVAKSKSNAAKITQAGNSGDVQSMVQTLK